MVPPEARQLFNHYAEGTATMRANGFARFLAEVQHVCPMPANGRCVSILQLICFFAVPQ
jgi:hypothetical protein